MKNSPRRPRFLKSLSLLLTALLMAFAVWVIAINTIDPMEKRIYPASIQLDVIGQDQNLAAAGLAQQKVELILTAPQSSWSKLIGNPHLIHAWVDLTGLAAGQFDLPIQTRIELPAVRVEDTSPRIIHVVLEMNIP